MSAENDAPIDGFEGSAGDAMPTASVGAAALGALLGAAAWAALFHFADREHGALAVGIGALVGALTVKAGGRGISMAVLAAALALVSIFGGKFIAARLFITEYREQLVQDHPTAEQYEERVVDAAGWAAIEDKDSIEEVKEYLNRHNFTQGTESPAELREIVDYFRKFTAPVLEEFHASPPSSEEWLAEARKSREERFDSEIDPLRLIQDDLGPLDLLFAFLGISTAFGLVSRA